MGTPTGSGRKRSAAGTLASSHRTKPPPSSPASIRKCGARPSEAHLYFPDGRCADLIRRPLTMIRLSSIPPLRPAGWLALLLLIGTATAAPADPKTGYHLGDLAPNLTLNDQNDN